MLVAHVRRMSAKRRAYVLLGLLAGLMVLTALIFGGPLQSGAQTTAATPVVGNCIPTLTAGTASCSFMTTTDLAAGGTMVIQLTNPNGANITSLSGVPAGCAVSQGIGTPIVTIACAVASLGMKSGTTIVENISPITSSVQFATESVTYNANGGAPQVPVPTANTGVCVPAAIPPGGTATCTNTPSVATADGGTLVITVTAPGSPVPPPGCVSFSAGPCVTRCADGMWSSSTGPGTCSGHGGEAATSGASIQITGAPGFVPAPPVPNPCVLQTALPTASGGSESVTYLCAVGASIPAGTPIPVTVVNTGTASSSPPVTSSTIGACTFYPAVAPFVSTCTNAPGQVTSAGGTLTFSISAPGGGTIDGFAAGSPPAMAGTCPNTATSSLPATTVTVTYTCTGAETAPVTPYSITITSTTGPASALPTEMTVSTNPPVPVPALLTPVETTTENFNGPLGPTTTPFPEIVNVASCPAFGPSSAGTTVTCPIPPSLAPPFFGTPPFQAQAGFTLAFQITASVGQTIFVAAGGAPPSIGAGGFACSLSTPLPTSVTYPEGTVVITYTCDTNQIASPPPAAGIIVTNASGVSGSPTQVIAVIAPNPPPGVPPPTTTQVVFTIAGVTSASATPVPTGTLPPTPASAGAAGFCSVASPTPAGCVTLNTNCVNPANAALPAQPAIATPSNPPAIATGGPYQGTTGNPVLFHGAAVPAPVASGAQQFFIVSCRWDFGDGASSRFLNPSHTYTVSGTYTATLTVVESNAPQTVSGTAVAVATPTALTATASTKVVIAPLGPLCQQPAGGGITGLGACFNQAPGCPSTSFNNNLCSPTCPFNGETLLPQQCPGPATGNQVWINGPFNIQVDQPLIVTVNTNVPGTSSLLPGDIVKFDWGDGSVNFNTPPPQYVPNANPAAAGGTTGGGVTTVSTTGVAAGVVLCADQSTAVFSGPGTCANNGGPAPINPGSPPPTYPAPPGFNPAFPAPMQGMHAYTYPGTYTIRVTLTFSDLTSATAQATATVTGNSASVTGSGQGLPPGVPAASQSLPPPPPPVAGPPVNLDAGCNTVMLTFADDTPITVVAQGVQGTTLVSIGETPDNAPPLMWYPGAGGANNLVSVRHGDVASICVTDPGSFVQPAS